MLLNLAEFWDDQRRQRLKARGWHGIQTPAGWVWTCPDQPDVVLTEDEAFACLTRMEREGTT